MCGIAGIVERDPERRADPGVARGMARVLLHRGPDGEGAWHDGPVALGHRRLDVIDLTERASQPMRSACGRYAIVYNGEIYNYRDLRRELEGRGVEFRSDSDTEVLLQMYAVHGRGALERLNGIFAFAIWDARERTLFAARDAVGVKPLYWCIDGERFRFASEIKALLEAGWPAEANTARLGEYLEYGSVSGEETLFRGVRRLLPGCWLEVGPADRLRGGRYFDVTDVEPGPERSPRRAAEAVREALSTAVVRQMVSDVPVGSMCSGGIDSSVITALSAEHSPGIHTFCIRVEDPGSDETSFGRIVSDHLHTTHHEQPSSAAEVARVLPTMIWLHDEPLTHPNSVPIFEVSKLAQRHVVVLLSGEGADEIFAGYARYGRVGRAAALRRVPALARRALPRLAAALGRPGLLATLSAANAPDPGGLVATLLSRSDPEAVRRLAPGLPLGPGARHQIGERAWAGSSGDLLRATLLNEQLTHLQTLLDRQDKMCMGASIESRVPFLDVDLVRLVNGLESGHKLRDHTTKNVLREASRGLLPEAIRARPKYAFSLPLTGWFGANTPLGALADRLEHGELAASGLIDPRRVAPLVRSVRAGRELHAHLLWFLLNLAIWWELWVTRREAPDLGLLPAWSGERSPRVSAPEDSARSTTPH